MRIRSIPSPEIGLLRSTRACVAPPLRGGRQNLWSGCFAFLSSSPFVCSIIQCTSVALCVNRLNLLLRYTGEHLGVGFRRVHLAERTHKQRVTLKFGQRLPREVHILFVQNLKDFACSRYQSIRALLSSNLRVTFCHSSRFSLAHGGPSSQRNACITSDR